MIHHRKIAYRVNFRVFCTGFLWLILFQFLFNTEIVCNGLRLFMRFVFDPNGHLQSMMIDVNIQRANRASNATSSDQKVRKRFRFGSIFAFNSPALKCSVVI